MPLALLLNKCTGIRENKNIYEQNIYTSDIFRLQGNRILCIAENSSRLYVILGFI
jgi:hypothetical protein